MGLIIPPVTVTIITTWVCDGDMHVCEQAAAAELVDTQAQVFASSQQHFICALVTPQYAFSVVTMHGHHPADTAAKTALHCCHCTVSQANRVARMQHSAYFMQCAGDADYWQRSAWQHIWREPSSCQGGQGSLGSASGGAAGSELRQAGQASEATAQRPATGLRACHSGKNSFELLLVCLCVEVIVVMHDIRSTD